METRAIAAELAAVVSDWKQVAEKTGLTRAEIERMASAFEHDDLKKAHAGSLLQLSQPRMTQLKWKFSHLGHDQNGVARGRGMPRPYGRI